MNSSEPYFFTLTKKTVTLVAFVSTVGGALVIPGTSSAEPYHVWESHVVFPESSTCSGLGTGSFLEEQSLTEKQNINTSRAVSDIRRISGLTWEELGRLFGVSRRSVHFWASGKPLRADNEVFLQKLLVFFLRIDRGSARDNRSAIFQACDGRTPFDLISEEKFSEAENILGRGAGRKELQASRLDRAEKLLRLPLPPEQLIDVMNDRIHRPLEKGRAVQTARIKRREVE